MSKVTILLHFCCLIVALTVSAPLMAQTLQHVLELTYQNNPDLKVRRIQMRVADEQVPQARSAMLPNISLTTNTALQSLENFVPENTPGRDSQPSIFGVVLNQRIYDFGRTSNRVDAAISNALAARTNIMATEQQVLLNAATQYANLVRDRALVKLRSDNITFVNSLLEDTRKWVREGFATETDVAQVEAQIAAIEGNLIALLTNVELTRENFEQIVGVPPGELSDPLPYFSTKPMSVDNATNIAIVEHPSVKSGNYYIDAAEQGVYAADSDLRPLLTFQFSYQRLQQQYSDIDDFQVTRAMVQLTLPIYDGGLSFARSRNARELLAQRRAELDVVRAQLNVTAQSAFANFDSAKDRIKKFQKQIEASKKSLDGMLVELKSGRSMRTISGVIAADAALFNARSALINARRDYVVASYQILAVLGRMTAKNLRLNVALHDEASHYREVNSEMFGTKIPD